MRPPGFEDDEFLLVLCVIVGLAGVLLVASVVADVLAAVLHTRSP